MNALRTLATAAVMLTLASTASALEPRTWVVLDGRLIEGELQAVSGNLATILDKDGKKINLDKSFLSIGDNAYIKENFPDAKAGFSAQQGVVMPMPAKMAKIDNRTFKATGETFSLPVGAFDVLETPHFKVMYQKPVDPKYVGELAERMWFDAAYVHEKFPQLFATGQKMAIFMAKDDTTYEGIGAWYAEMVKKGGNLEAGNKIASIWPPSAGGRMSLSNEVMSQYKLFSHARVFRAYRKKNSQDTRPDQIKDVWSPFWVNCLAQDMLSLQTPNGVSDFGSKGYFALARGHSYYKEVVYTGKSETSMITAQSESGADVSSTKGFQDAHQWASEVKKAVRKGELKATFEALNGLSDDNGSPKNFALCYAWARYLESSIPKLTAFSKTVGRISTSRQVPAPDDFAKLYGFEDAAQMEADFQKWIMSTEFR
jgi:hypothetical protein